jgi:tetratricopeptide (TPR) repeat protein
MSTPASPTSVEQIHALLEQSRGHHEANELDAAEAAAREAFALAEVLYRARPRDHEVRAALALACTRMAGVCRATDQPDEAEAVYRLALPLLQQLTDAQPVMLSYREELAATHTQLGQLLADSGRGDEAVPQLREARTAWEQLAAADPGNREYRLAVAGCCFTLGYLHAAAGRDRAAEKNFKQAQALWEPLLREADDAEARYYLGRSFVNLVVLYRGQGRDEEAREAARDAVATVEALRRDHPDTAAFACRELIRVFSELRCLHLAAGRAEEARAFQQRLAAAHQELARADPGDAEQLRELTRSYRELADWFQDTRQRLDEAEEALRQALAVGQQQARAHPGPDGQFDLAETWDQFGALCWTAQRPDAAEEAYRQAILLVKPLARDHPDVPAYASRMASCENQLGIVYEETGRLDEAAEAYQKALSLLERLAQGQPEDVENATHLGGILCHLGNVAYAGRQFGAALTWYRRAVRWLKEMIEKHGPSPKAEEFLTNARAGRADAETPVAVPTEAEVAAATTFSFRLPGPPPRFPPVAVAWPAGVALGPEGLAAHLNDRPEDAAGWFWMGRTLGQAGDCEEALTAFDRVLALLPDHPAAQYDRADVLRCLGRGKEALEAVDRLLKADRRDASAWYLRGLILGDFLDARGGGLEPFHAGRNGQAVDAFNKALLLRPDDADARLYKGLALYRACAAAQAGYRGLADAAAKSGMAGDAVGVYVRPRLLAYKGCFARARESFEQASRLRPDDARGWYYLGRLLVDFEGGHEATAEEAFARVVACEPDRADAWMELARLADRRTDRVQALAHLRRAVVAEPGLRKEARHAFAWLTAGDLP